MFASLFDPGHKHLNQETVENVNQFIHQTVKSLIKSYEETFEEDRDQIIKNTTAPRKLKMDMMNYNYILMKFQINSLYFN